MSDEIHIVANPEEGYDRQDPAPAPLLAFSVVTLVTILAVFAFVFAYYGAVADYEVQKQIGDRDSRDLREIRGAADKVLKGDEPVRTLTVDQAMERFEKEVREGRLFYPAKAMPVKVDGAVPGAGGPAVAAAVAAPVPAAPAAAKPAGH